MWVFAAVVHDQVSLGGAGAVYQKPVRVLKHPALKTQA
jgi:hypothetical protein